MIRDVLRGYDEMITSELKTTKRITIRIELYRAEEYNKVVCDVAVRTTMRSREYYYSVVCDVAVRTKMRSRV